MTDTSISKFAAKCRKTHRTRPADFRASDWKSCTGDSRPLSVVRDAIVAEITRQDAVARGRVKPVKASGSIMGGLRAQLKTARQFKEKQKWAFSLAVCQPTGTGEFRCGNLLLKIQQEESCDWNRYSKSWHRAHGPARTYSTTITVSRLNARLQVESKSYPQTRLQNIDRRAIEAVAEFLGLPKLRGQQGLRISPYVELVQVASPHKRCTVYERRLAGELLGHVAVRRDTHYHAPTAEAACDGVSGKLARERLAQRHGAAAGSLGLDLGKPIGAILRGLGFCKEGTADALEILGLDDSRYTVEELVSSGNWDRLPRVAAKYPKEVGIIATVLAGAQLPAQLSGMVRGLVG